MRFTVTEGGLQLGPDGCPVAADLHYEGPANQRRAKADTLSKVRLLCLACCILVAFTLLDHMFGQEWHPEQSVSTVRYTLFLYVLEKSWMTLRVVKADALSKACNLCAFFKWSPS